MKGILVILDGVGDLPCKQLDNQTPLEAAKTPNLDFLATYGKLGYMHTVRKGFIPESDEAIVSIFGNDLISSARGQLESIGSNIPLSRGDLSLRVNFATIDSLDDGNVVDRRAGRTLTTREAKILADALNKIKLPVKFLFKQSIQHRAVLVFQGGFSENITGNDATYVHGEHKGIGKIMLSKPTDDDENSQYTSNILNEFLEKSYSVLNTHPINQERRKKGLLPANYLLVRGPGIEIPKLKQYKKWMSIAYMPLEIGFSKACGMQLFSFEYPELKNFDSYENLYEGLKQASEFSIKTIKENNKKADYVYIHIKETDLPGHDNKPIEKKEMIEYLDSTLFKFLKDFAYENNAKIVVTADHSTPCKLKNHSADPVPVLFYDHSNSVEKRFTESESKKGILGELLGSQLLKKVGFVK